MKPLDCVLCTTAALFGVGAFRFALHGVGDPRNQYPGGSCPSALSA